MSSVGLSLTHLLGEQKENRNLPLEVRGRRRHIWGEEKGENKEVKLLFRYETELTKLQKIN